MALFHRSADGEGKRVLLIMNPSSGIVKTKTKLFDIIDRYAGSGCITTTMRTSGAGDAARFVAENAYGNDLVICSGGDGTLNEVISGMMTLPVNKRVPIGFLPTGSTNDMARSLKLPFRSLKKCMKITLSGEAGAHDVGCFNGQRYFNYVSSFGAFTRVSYATPRWLKNLLGHFAYILDGIVSVGEIKACHMRIETDNDVIEDDFIYGGVTNALSVGGLVRLKEDDVSLNDGLFEVMLIRNPKTAQELQQIINSVLRQKFDDKYVRFLHTSHIVFHPQTPVSWTIDGEFGGCPDSVTIDNVHSAVKIMRKG